MDKYELQQIMFRQILDKLSSGLSTPLVSNEEKAEVIDLEFERLKRRNKS